MEALSENTLFIQLAVVAILIVIDWVANVAAAIQRREFDWAKVPRFLVSNVVPYVLIWGVLAGAGWVANALGIQDAALYGILIFVEAAYAVIVLRLGQSILSSFSAVGLEKTSE